MLTPSMMNWVNQQPNNVGPMAGKNPNEKIPSGYRKSVLQNYTPQQLQQHEQLFSNVGPESYLAKLSRGDQGTFDEMEAPALRQFNELQGGLASRFSGMGLGGRQGSGFRNASNSAAQDFASQLQSNRVNLQRQALMDLMGYSDMLLNQKPYEIGLAEKRQKQSGWGGLFGAGIGAAGGFFAGGPSGALQGAQLGYNFGSSF